MTGVVLFVSDTEIDVWIDEGMVRRTRPDRVRPYPGDGYGSLAAIAADARVFAAMEEGDRVAWQDPDGTVARGLLLEKCRYGALVAREDGALVALGFRKLFPRAAGAAPS